MGNEKQLISEANFIGIMERREVSELVEETGQMVNTQTETE